MYIQFKNASAFLNFHYNKKSHKIFSCETHFIGRNIDYAFRSLFHSFFPNQRNKRPRINGIATATKESPYSLSFYIIKCYSLTSVSDIYNSTFLESISEHRILHRLVIFMRINSEIINLFTAVIKAGLCQAFRFTG